MVDEVRIFDVFHNRSGDINQAVLCNGHTHFICRDASLTVTPVVNDREACDAESCQVEESEVLDISRLSVESQQHLGLLVPVPPGMVLVVGTNHHYSSGAQVAVKLLDQGVILGADQGMVSDVNGYTYYLRNNSGKAIDMCVGTTGRWWTNRKLARLRIGERSREVSYEVSNLQGHLLELMQLHRTPEVTEEIENVKELLRLASSLSVEASIEAAEGQEQIAADLAAIRAREIGAELGPIRSRLMREQQSRQAAYQELKQHGF